LTPTCFLGRLQVSITIVFPSIQHRQFFRAAYPEEAAVCLKIICQCAALLELH
jgi:hypothetical protein